MRLDFGEQGARQHGKNGQFVVEGGIEDGVGSFLEGENPCAFAAADVGPHFQGAGGGMSAIAMVADQTANQAVVGGGDAVVVVQVELGQRRNIDVEFPVFGEAGR